jgi:hypothetical protein
LEMPGETRPVDQNNLAQVFIEYKTFCRFGGST